MRDRFVTATFASAVILLMASSPAAQAPPTTNGKPWSPPRTADGKPDLQGMWAATIGGHTFEEGGDPEAAVIQGDEPPSAERPKIIKDPTPDGRIPYQPWAEAKRREHLRNLFAPGDRAHVEPEDRCLLNGVPRINLRGQMQIVQTSGYVLILYEWIHAYRYIPLDGRPHVANGVRLWNGDSRGRWEGDTLVVDVTNFHVDAKNYNNQPWLDGHGSFYTDALHVVERWRLSDPAPSATRRRSRTRRCSRGRGRSPSTWCATRTGTTSFSRWRATRGTSRSWRSALDSRSGPRARPASTSTPRVSTEGNSTAGGADDIGPRQLD